MPEIHLRQLGPDDSDAGDQAAVTVNRFPFVVGRHPDCDHRLDNPTVSRRHCAFSIRDGRVWVEDLGSRNGTRLNGEPLREARPLEDGDRLDVYSLPFQVRVVEAPAAADEPEGEDLEAVPAAGSRQVLVVEDDDTVAVTLAVMLKSWGHEVRVARDGPAAIEAARAQQPDTVFLDIRLPGMDGFEVARRLRKDAGLQRARMVAVTGDEGALDVLRSREKFERLLVKPVSANALHEALGQPG